MSVKILYYTKIFRYFVTLILLSKICNVYYYYHYYYYYHIVSQIGERSLT